MAVRGEVWLANLEPVVGHEQGKTRPVLIVSNDRLNSAPIDLVVWIPFTSAQRSRIPATWIESSPPDGGLTVRSWAICEHVRSASKSRLIRKLGEISPTVMTQVEDRLRILLDL
ncbi:MAG: type II toxin-antitoxin system PemK/MazF family toxin [Candidatus Sericytochromatia bacterium]|uniref:mRNA interferase n=1 Tax=Candidatus Tanganyikabacteria bacterium TaxID=2961651 RepID=A0A937X8V3_9BACT|nr:type II toxin-antitoxin system PemK/MazF family toxin [Candidatus Tanganyikabacteria bacterium]